MQRAFLVTVTLVAAVLTATGCDVQVNRQTTDTTVTPPSDTTGGQDVTVAQCEGDPTCNREGVCAGLADGAEDDAVCVGGVWVCDYSEVADYEEQETLCDGLDNDCDGQVDGVVADPADVGTVCEPVGVCQGEGAVAVCAEGNWICDYSAVAGFEAVETQCDGLDNDCDGVTDGFVGDLEVSDCNRDGACGGDGVVALCLGDGEWTCDYSDVEGWEPAETSCDGVDNDCDGETDEDLLRDAPAEACPAQGVCDSPAVRQSCVDGDWSCDYAYVAGYEAEETSCDGLDNDCDGSVDENLTHPAAEGECPAVGACEGATATVLCTDGEPVCDFSGTENWEADETACDAIDNDCDGETDENIELIGEALAAAPLHAECAALDTGVCAGLVTGTCTGGGPTCNNGAIGTELFEEGDETLCDGLDNDCDGETDEGLVLANDELGDQAPQCAALNVGLCADTVTATCVDGAWACDLTAAEALDGWEAEETQCDGVDNDCDGRVDGMVIDESHADIAEAGCQDEGACADGILAVCLEGSWLCEYVSDDYQPGVELDCDNVDNDCDGETDELLTGSREPSALAEGGCADEGVCAGLVTADCSAGTWSCNYSAVVAYEASETLCDELDNDCDGSTDLTADGSALSDAVAAGCRLQGICAGVITASCTDGEWSCDYDAIEGFEENETLCDGDDNDCNGTVDLTPEGEPLSDLAAAGCPTAGVCDGLIEAVCSGGAWSCDTSAIDPYEDGVELSCDGLDNDCDGETDEEAEVASDPERFAGCLAEGVCAVGGVESACTEGAWVCNYDAVVDFEDIEATCDTLDNDCDGTTDVGVCTGDGAPCPEPEETCDSGVGCRLDVDGDGLFCAQDATSCVVALDEPIAQQVVENETLCMDARSYKSCGAGEWSELTACPEETPYCLVADGGCHLCQPDTVTCNGNDIVTCDAAGDAFTTSGTCAGDDFCAGAGLCIYGAEFSPLDDGTGIQNQAAVTANADLSGDDPVVEWGVAWSFDDGTGAPDIMFQRVLSVLPDGGDLLPGRAWVINQSTTGAQVNPSVAAASDRRFVVAWEDQGGADGSGRGVYARVLATNGLPSQGNEVVLSATTANHQDQVRITTYLGGTPDSPVDEIAAAWRSVDGIYYRRYTVGDSTNPIVPIDAEDQLVANLDDGEVANPDVAVGAGATVAVVWQVATTEGNGEDVFLRLFYSDGTSSDVIAVAGGAAGDQIAPRIEAIPELGFLVVWESNDSDGRGIAARLFDNTGGALSTESIVATLPTGDQTDPDVALDPATGRGIVTWTTTDADGTGVAYRSVYASATGLTWDADEALLNSDTAGPQLQAAPDATHGVVFTVWTTPDIDGDGLLGRQMSIW